MRKIALSVLTIAALAIAVTGGTFAVFSDTGEIAGNTISTAKVNIDIRALNSGKISKPLNVTGLVPGQWTKWGRAEIYNESDSTTVKYYMYVKNVSGAACNKVNLRVTTGYAGGDERARDVYNGTLTGLQGTGNRKELTGNPPFETVLPNWTQVIQQTAQLDSSAGNSYQNTSCTWDEVFVAENVDPNS